MKKLRDFVEQVAWLRISGEVGCPDCGGPLGEEGVDGRECLNCGETWPLNKLDEWSADDAFDSREALNRLIYDARELLKGEGHNDLLSTLEWTLEQLENLTTEEYSIGGDKAIRERLRETIAKARGQI
jgi:hypothetical protein